MPYVLPLPEGNNVSLVRSIDERTRSIEAARNALNISVNTADVFTLTTSVPAVWVEMTANGTNTGMAPSCMVNVGRSGAIWTIFQVTPSNLGGSAWFGNLAPGIDHAAPTGTSATANTYSTAGDPYVQLTGVSGVTPGWHTVTMWEYQLGVITAPQNFSNMMLSVWAL
jgi:hypothetical protein